MLANWCEPYIILQTKCLKSYFPILKKSLSYERDFFLITVSNEYYKMKRYPLYIALLLSLIISCAEKEATTPQKQIQEKVIPTVATQNYETALFDLLLNADSLLKKGMHFYTAIQIFDNRQPSKYYFHSFSKQNGELKYCELLGKDTIVSERILTSKPTEIRTEKMWPQIHRKVFITSIFNMKNEITHFIEKEKNNPPDTTQYVRIKGTLNRVRYPSRDIETYDHSHPNRTTVTYLKKNNDTLFQYQIIENNGLTIGKKYTMGLSHSYSYSYNALGQLTEMIWKENKKKVNAIIQFRYNNNGLPVKRIIKSPIPAFGNSVTTFEYR